MERWEASLEITQNRFVEATRDAAQEMTVSLAVSWTIVVAVSVARIIDVWGRRLLPEQFPPDVQRRWAFFALMVVVSLLSAVWAGWRSFSNPFSGSGTSFSAKGFEVSMTIVGAVFALVLLIVVGTLRSDGGGRLTDARLWPLWATVVLTMALSGTWLIATVS